MHSFSLDAQKWFANWSGDFNPIHVDPVYARRTQAGAPVVHGVHALLWALDTVLAEESVIPQIISIKAQFLKYIIVDARVNIIDVEHKNNEIRFKILAGDLIGVVVSLRTGTIADSIIEEEWVYGLPASPAGLQDLLVAQMAETKGQMALTNIHLSDCPYPTAAKALGHHRVLALAGLSRLVGMTCPGLNSIFSSITLRFVAQKDLSIAYRTTAADPRYNLIKMDVAGAGIVGNISAFARAPVSTAWKADVIAGSVCDAEFSGVNALIIGGSRGLGALTAHLIVAGGGRTVVTYKVGRDDAASLAHELNRTAQREACQIVELDVLSQEKTDFDFEGARFTHLYYFATPLIFRQKPERFDRSLFDLFCDYYISGFATIVNKVLVEDIKLTIFYPSSEFVSTIPASMTEYSMAKAAGEVLCRQMHGNAFPVHVIIDRLPRLPTDQTLGIAGSDLADPAATMLDVVRRASKTPRH
jgi:hypothetical protein